MGTRVASDTLFALLKAQRGPLLARWMERTRRSLASAGLTRGELLDRMPAFVDELIAALYPEALPLPPASTNPEEHGEQRLRLGFDVSEVIREYGLLHECILQTAREARIAIGFRDQEVIAKWINVGIADAVSQYVRQRDVELQRQTSEHLGFIAHELRGPMTAARLALWRLRERELAAGGRAVDVLERNLHRTAEMIDSTLSAASLKMGLEPRRTELSLDDFLREIEADAAAEAQARGIRVEVTLPRPLTVRADPRLLRSAIANLLHNALKFSHKDSTVELRARDEEGAVSIEVADSCGGLPPGKAEELFAPLVQRNDDRSGFGLGLAIALQAAQAHNGTIQVRDVPGVGCVFSLVLPVPGG